MDIILLKNNNLSNVTVPNSVEDSPVDYYNYCYYFDVGVNVTWNGNNYTCEVFNSN